MDPLQIISFIILIMLSAFFSGSELALMSLPVHKLESLFKENKFGSKSLKKVKRNNDRLLITILIGNNLVNTFTAAFATTIAINLAKSSGLGINEATMIGISTGLVTLLLLLFGEIIPKSIATKNAVPIALFVAPIYKIIMIILYPIISFLEIIIKFFSRGKFINTITGAEIESFVDMGKESGALEHDEHEKIKNILEFGNTDVEEIMIPRVRIEGLSNETTVKEAFEYYKNHTHSRLPIFTESIDKITHFLTIRDILDQNKDKKLKDLDLSEVLKVPLNQPIDSVLKTFQNSRKHLAIVMDEYGGVAGLITLEDIIEEIFGEIRDETDKEIDDIREIGTDSLIVQSDVLFEEVLRKFNLDFQDLGLDEKEFEGETLSYLITHKLERFPKDGEIINFELCSIKKHECTKIQFKVINVINSRIGNIEVKKS